MLMFVSSAPPTPTRLSWRKSLVVPGRLVPTSALQPAASESWLLLPPVDPVHLGNTPVSPAGTPVYDRLRSPDSTTMPIGQIRALPVPVSSSHPQSSDSGSTPTTLPRPLPLVPSRSHSQLDLPLDAQPLSRPTSRTPSPAVPASGSVPLPPSAPDATHPLPSLPPRALTPAPTTPSSASWNSTSGYGPASSVTDLSHFAVNTHTKENEARVIPHVMVYDAAESTQGIVPSAASQPSPLGSPQPLPSSSEGSPLREGSPLLPGSPNLATPQKSPVVPSPLTPQPGAGFAARFGKKKRQLSRDLLRRGGTSCEDLFMANREASINIPSGDGEIQMIAQHHKQTMGLPDPPQSPNRPPRLNLNLFSARARKESIQTILGARRPSSPSVTPRSGSGPGAGEGLLAVADAGHASGSESGSVGGRKSSSPGPSSGGFTTMFASPKAKDKKPPSPPKLKTQGILGNALGIGLGVAGRGSLMPHSPSIAAALEYMRHEQDRGPRGSFSSRRAIGGGERKGFEERTSTDDGHAKSSESDAKSSYSDAGAETSSGPSSSVASLLSAGTGTGTSASEVDGKILGWHGQDDSQAFGSNPDLTLESQPLSVNSLYADDMFNPQARPHPRATQDPDKRVSTASSQRTLTAFNNKRESGIFTFPGLDSNGLARMHTTDGLSPASDPFSNPGSSANLHITTATDEKNAFNTPIARPARLGQLAGSLKRRSASMSILLPSGRLPSGESGSGPSSPRFVPPPLPLRRAPPTDGTLTDSEGYMSSASNAGTPGRRWGKTQGGIKGKIAAWTAASDSHGRRKHPRTAGGVSASGDMQPRRSDSPHQGQGYPYSHSPASAPALQVHTHIHLPSHAQTPLMTIAALAPAARDLALGVGKRVEKFCRARSASGAGEPQPTLGGSPSSATRMGTSMGTGLEPTLPPPLRPALPGASGLLFGRALDDPVVLRDLDGWTDENLGVRRCVGLPAFVSRSVRYLERWGGDEEGLFRISGRPSHVSRLRAEFDAGADYDLGEIHPGDLDPHAVSSLFKAYLRELPETILTRSLRHQFDFAMTTTDSISNASFDLTRLPTSMTSFGESSENMRPVDASLLADIKALIDQLPQVNYNLLHELCHLLRYTTQHAHTTKMPLGNLLLLFCPTLSLSAGFLRCLVEGQDTLFEWGRQAPVVPIQPPTPSALPPRNSPAPTVSSSSGMTKHAPSASLAPASLRSLKSPLSVSTDLAQPRSRSQTTTGSGPPSRASMFFPNLGPRRPSIGMLFGGNNRNSIDAKDVQESRSSDESSDVSEGQEADGLYMSPKKAKRVTRPPRVSLDIPDGSFAPSLSPPKPRTLPEEPEESPLKRVQTPIADLFKSPLTAAVPTVAPSAVTATGTCASTSSDNRPSPSKTVPPRLGLPFRDGNDEVDEMGWSRGVFDAASASLGQR